MDKVNVTIITRDNKRKSVSVEGKLISIEGYPYQFCVHRSPEPFDDSWRVSEYSTGCFFAAGNSADEAIFTAGERLKQNGIDNLNKAVSAWKEKLDNMDSEQPEDKKPFPAYPQKYDINNPEEIKRLYIELLGYMKVSLKSTCPRCHIDYREGTDFQGRQFAIDALEELVK